ncbi:GNAT family N-acetyltransferase [Psychroserpens ponticola]|uniref:GNAT family N-acetyltransferase n=1 Tax=Psychroserpens ponticola TaxID=2932268 RepID=A0ABY7S5C7_9FLAO|nr:GNAT family N-acetyltransferase [Psychroserpens ponticola]WCO03090.1 GNAT family N-acetyltransferase [Psychroserpens ponticola]
MKKKTKKTIQNITFTENKHEYFFVFMNQNPFTSSTFESIWSKHFNDNNALLSFKFINGVKFIKHSKFGTYVNAGRNLTKGIDYSLDYNETDYKGKTFLIYDVPTYFGIEEFNPPKSSGLKLKKMFQYQGFLMDVSEFKDKDEYINAQFSSKNRREFRSNQRRLETCFNITYEFINEAVSRDKFDKLFKQFHTLLNERFEDKQVNYHHLSHNKWAYYTELVFEMLKEKKASLLVIYNEEEPIGITLNFHADTVLFETITVFDPDYYKFSIGKTSIIKLLEWCFENGFTISDFSKGDFEYKHKWGNLAYDFNYHILYDSKSIKSILTSKYIELFYNLKLYLRKKKVNEIYRKYKFLFSGNKSKENTRHSNFKMSNINEFDENDYDLIDFYSDDYKFFLVFIYSYAFATSEPIQNVKVFRSKENSTETYLISGSKKVQQVVFNSF